MFNALKYTQELEKAGFTRDQAETSMKLLIEVMNDNFATKADLKELELKMESRFQSLESKLDAHSKDTDAKFRELEYKLVIKLSTILGTMMTLAIGVTATLVKILPALGQ